MKRILLIATLLFTSILSAQDWAPFKASDTLVQYIDTSEAPHFRSNYLNSTYRSHAIQSISTQSTTHQNNKTTITFEKGYPIIAKNPPFSFFNKFPLILKGRLLGDTAFISSDTTKFKTIDSIGFSLTFPHKYHLGQNWELGQSLQFSIKGTVDSLYSQTIGQFGIDSLVKIKLTVFDTTNQISISHKFNNSSIIISKTNGLIKTIDFTSIDIIVKTMYEKYQLSNIPLTNNDYYSLTTGDEYHFSVEEDWWPHSKHIAKIISDNTSGSIRTLRIEDKWVPHYGGTPIQVNTILKSFDVNKITNDKKSMIVDDSIISQTHSGGLAKIMFHSDKPGLENLIEYNTYYSTLPSNSQSGMVDIDFDPFEHSFETFRRIGLPIDKFQYDSYGGQPESDVIIIRYVKKGNQTWGNPYNFTVGLEEKSVLENSIQLYPNLVKDIITIKSTEKIQLVRIYTIDGKLQLVSQNSPSIEISNFQSGLYLIQITTNRGVVTKRLIKE